MSPWDDRQTGTYYVLCKLADINIGKVCRVSHLAPFRYFVRGKDVSGIYSRIPIIVIAFI